MIINRAWAMPNKWTFKIKPIKQLLDKYVGGGVGWIDPFAGENSPAEITNDLNPDSNAVYNLHAYDFVKQLPNAYPGIIFDPPYSLRQVKEIYDSIGLKMSFDDSKRFPNCVKDLASKKILPSGIAISCGWNSGGFGKSRGFEIIEILLVAHGGHHNDTIVTVERKINTNLNQWDKS